MTLRNGNYFFHCGWRSYLEHSFKSYQHFNAFTLAFLILKILLSNEKCMVLVSSILQDDGKFFSKFLQFLIIKERNRPMRIMT